MITAPLAPESIEAAVGASSVTFGITLAAGNLYVLVANVAMWWTQAASSPTASAGSGSMYLPANAPVYVRGDAGAKVAVIEDSTGGKAAITRVFTI